MAIFFNTGFEHRVLSNSGGGLIASTAGTAPTISTTTFRNGSAALRINTAATSELRPANYTASQIVCMRFGFRWATKDTNPRSILEWVNGATFLGLGINSSNFLYASVFSGSNTDYWTGSQALAQNTWYVIEILWNCSANPWTVRVILRSNDGTLLEDSGTQTTLASAAANIGTINLGTASTRTIDYFYDDWLCASGSAADFPLGNGKGVWIVAGSDGTHNTPGGATFINGDATTTPNFTNSTTTAWTFLDDSTWSTTRSTTDNVSAETHVAGDYLEIAPAATPETGNANCVRALLMYSSVTGTANGGSATVIRNGSGTQTEIFGNFTTGQDYSETTNFFKAAYATNPGTWTPTNVNACRWRIGRASNSSDVSPRPTWQGLALEVDYPVAAPPVERSAALAATAALASVATFFSIFERATALAATGAIATASTFFSIFERTLALNAAGAISTSGTVTPGATVHSRSAALAATGNIASSGTFLSVFERSGALAATGGIATDSERALLRSATLNATAGIASQATFSSILERSSVLNASAAIASEPERVLHRSVALNATAACVAAGEIAGAVQRSAALNATGAILTDSERELLRRVALNGTGVLSASGQIDAARSASLQATGAIAASGSFYSILEGSASLSALADVSAAGSTVAPESERTVSFTANASIAVAGVGLSPPPPGYIDFPGIGLITRPVGGSQIGAGYRGSIPDSGVGSLAQTTRGVS